MERSSSRLKRVPENSISSGTSNHSSGKQLSQKNLKRWNTLSKLPKTEDLFTAAHKSEMQNVTIEDTHNSSRTVKRSYSLSSLLATKEMTAGKNEGSASRPSSKIRMARRRSVRKLKAFGMLRKKSLFGFSGAPLLPDIVDEEKMRRKKEKVNYSAFQ